jgi:hypothetical protein
LKQYESLFRLSPIQSPTVIFAHFYPPKRDPNSPQPPDYDHPFREIARSTLDGFDSWTFQQQKFRNKYPSSEVPKLKNYLNYTFVRLLTLDSETPGSDHFLFTARSKLGMFQYWFAKFLRGRSLDDVSTLQSETGFQYPSGDTFRLDLQGLPSGKR